MKGIYILGSLAVLAGLVFFIMSCQNKPAKKDDTTAVQPANSRTIEKDPAASANDTARDNPYMGLRGIALSVMPGQLGLSYPAEEVKVYGVVMDWDVGGGMMTLVSFQTGDASIYLSSGGGFLGGRGHENVSNAAKALVAMAQDYVQKATPTTETPLAPKDGVRFYFLTNKGKYSASELVANFENKRSPWLRLFEKANEVISEYRLVSGNQ